jgi:hypothetical protein
MKANGTAATAKWGRNTRQCNHERFVVCAQLKSMTFIEMGKMSDCCVCSQQFSQTWGSETPCQSIFWRKNQVATNGRLIFAA